MTGEGIDLARLLYGAVVAGFACFLLGLALTIAIAPRRAERFLGAFASSARLHFIEQGVRLLVGLAMISYARWMWHPAVFRVIGWLVAVTAVMLLVLPWRWHQRFATMVMPGLFRRLWLFGVGALAFGAFILYSLVRAGLA